MEKIKDNKLKIFLLNILNNTKFIKIKINLNSPETLNPFNLYNFFDKFQNFLKNLQLD